MDGNVIKSFLVGLGFDVDDKSLEEFNKAITNATLKVAALSTSIIAAATGVTYGITKISEDFEQIGYEYRLITPAINKAILLRREMLKAYGAAGINLQKTAVAATKLNFSIAKTKFALDAIYKGVGAKFFGLITKQSDLFRQKIYANMPKILLVLEKLVKFVFKSLEAVYELGSRLWSILTRVYDFFVKLDEKTQGWSTVILAVIAAWTLLNLSFLATPLGMIIAGLVAILALFDDFETWKQGGKSLFDWAPFVPVIDAVSGALKSLWSVLTGIGEVLGEIAAAIYLAFTGNGTAAIDALKTAGQGVITVFERLWETLKGIVGSFGAIGTWISTVAAPGGALGNFFSRLFGGGPGAAIAGGNLAGNVAQNIQNAPKGVPPVGAPIGSNVTNQSQTRNMILNQQTAIHVQGTADAQMIGKTASQNTKQNFDNIRNMQGSTR